MKYTYDLTDMLYLILYRNTSVKDICSLPNTFSRLQIKRYVSKNTGKHEKKAMSDACWTKRTYLTLTNDLGPGLQLSLHCKSGSVDLGQQHLAPQGSWSFDFCSSFWGVTSYFCNVVWNGGNKWFDVYTGERDSFICGECGWSIRPTGPCRDHGGKVDCFPWNS
ncbi:hypothetical protein POPTR_017G144361v4 [Populus trichocarpa]|uniref:Uncharacterized protein n=2 Tax=Populus trichocarpa TaxID=3694 RepID=A0ACC0RSB5_POPTR|nr:hypothetical protein POPTR_017G144361v4 [Populus trichocarpa]